MMEQTRAGEQQDGLPQDEVDLEDILGIVNKHDRGQGGLIAILEEIQARCGYLPEKALRTVAESTGRSLVDVYGIATFYRSFSLEPRGKHIISACLGTACHVRGAPMVVEELERQLGVEAGQTTPDRQFTLETVNCLGACALGPIVVVDGHYFSNVNKARVAGILEDARRGLEDIRIGQEGRSFPIEVHCPRCNHSLMDPKRPLDGLPSVRVMICHEDKHYGLSLTSLYGGRGRAWPPEIPAGEVAEFFCPHCHGRLVGESSCIECGSPMVPMIVRAGGIIQVCARRGCDEERLDLNGVNV